MLGDLARSGFDVVDDHEEADAIVVNTCAFVEEAKTESLEVNMHEIYSRNVTGSAYHIVCIA